LVSQRAQPLHQRVGVEAVLASEVARYQMPAKLTDALAMGTPVLASPVPPLADLGRRGVLTYVDQEPLATRLGAVLADAPGLQAQVTAGRELFLDEYNYAATLPRLETVVDRALATAPSAPQSWAELLAFARAGVAPAPSEGLSPATIPAG
jgi:hypothetical protein